ncbi:MAG: ABC-2 type transport system ATP-binding protein [Parcubacteria group bacterium Athens0416_74]|nr:MAG: ABC-2 type transport system ATP-binding protein [Parcubacteria group bacterium Athens0416_74]
MNTKPIIEIRSISKSYRIGEAKDYYSTLRDSMGTLFSKKARQDSSVFWALKDVSFSVQAGEIVGVIGRNGAGKSTLLKILNRITEPTSGEAVIRGKISSLLEVGTGFHPELTGRENIYFAGAILGMKRKEIASKFDEIVQFAEMQQFLDTPVKRYSSGMQVRLAFSVAVHMEPDILLIDEVLAVGDLAFQRKCLSKIHETARRDGRTILFVSHNLDVVQSLCDRCVFLEYGQVQSVGPTEDVIRAYMARMNSAASESRIDFPSDETKMFELSSVMLRDSEGAPETVIEAGKPFSIEVEYIVRGTEPSAFWLVAQCMNENGTMVFGSIDTDNNPTLTKNRMPGSYRAIFTFPNSGDLGLNVGDYTLTIRIHQDPTREAIFSFRIEDDIDKYIHRAGVVFTSAQWRVSRLGE